jgi:hypothetical protein
MRKIGSFFEKSKRMGNRNSASKHVNAFMDSVIQTLKQNEESLGYEAIRASVTYLARKDVRKQVLKVVEDCQKSTKGGLSLTGQIGMILELAFAEIQIASASGPICKMNL